MKGSRSRLPPFGINRDVRRTLVDQITDGIRGAIRTGYYRPGERLPPMRVFEEAFGVSRIVTNAVMANLTAEGLIHPRRGAGAEVLNHGERIWKGSALVVFRDESGVFYMNVLGARIRDRLVRGGYLTSQVTVPNGVRGRDFTLLDANLRQHVDLVILVFNDDEIESHLASAGVPYIVVGDGGGDASTCVGTIRYRRSAAAAALARQCAAAGVRSVIQATVAEFPQDDIGAAFAGSGIKVKTWKIRRAVNTGHPFDFLKGAADAFERRISRGRDWLPDLIYFTDDHLATGAFAVLPSHGIRIPEDVKVVSWANAGYGPVFRTSVARMEMDPLADGDVVASRAIEYLESRRRIDGAYLEPAYVEGATFPCNNKKENTTMTTILHSGSQRCAQFCRFALMLGLCLSGATASATEWQIPSPNDGNDAAVTALTNALANCEENDIVTLSSGVYDLAGIVSHSNETYGASHLLTPSSKTITLRGDPSLDREDVVLKGDGTARILFLKKVGCKIENISFTNGFAKTGAVVYTDATLPSKAGLCDLSNCVFRCNVSDSNAGVAYGATLYNCLAESNRAKTYAGVIQYAKVFNTTFRRNSAKNGGACYQTDAMGCIFEENSSESDGGALTYNCTASNCVFRFNSAGGAGGAGNGSYAMRDCRFIGNSSGGNGGALSGQQRNVTGCWFESNWARGANQHGALYGVAANSILVQDCIFTNNAAGKGNGVGQDVAVWSNCLFVANQMRAVEKGQAGVSGGTFYKCVFRGQWSAAAGSSSQSPTNSYAESRRWQQMLSVRNGNLFDCTIEGCVTNCVMTRCTIAGCTNTPVVIFGTAALTNCLVAGNRTVSDASVNQPLGLFYGDTSGAGISLVNCTVADNQGTVFNNVGGNIANTIFFGNTEADITAKGTYGTALTFDHCLYRTYQSTASTEPVFSGCVVLGAAETLSFNGTKRGEYPYYMPRSSSKAVNAGKTIDWGAGAVDLCGNPRVRDGLVDIGCYESVIPPIGFIIRFH